MKPVVIFGTGTMARLAWHCFKTETTCSVAAFCIDDEYFHAETFCTLPVVCASKLYTAYPPEKYRIFVALGYQKLNKIRRDIFERYKKIGYESASCISLKALISNEQSIGENCFVMAGAILQPFSVVGNNCICWSGCVVAHESRVGDHCFLAAHSVIGGMATVGDATFLGMNSTVRNAVHVGKRCLVGAGSLILEDLADDSLVVAKATPVSPTPASAALRFIDI